MRTKIFFGWSTNQAGPFWNNDVASLIHQMAKLCDAPAKLPPVCFPTSCKCLWFCSAVVALLPWLSSYFINRMQYITLGRKISAPLVNDSAILQRSLLFLICVQQPLLINLRVPMVNYLNTLMMLPCVSPCLEQKVASRSQLSVLWWFTPNFSKCVK